MSRRSGSAGPAARRLTVKPARRMGAFGIVAVVTTASACLGAGGSAGVTPPVVTADAPSGTAAPAPPEPTEQRSLCAVPVTTTSLGIPAAATLLNVPQAWRFSRGRGQTVAVIDTGVTPHPRLQRLRGGGDYVSSTDGLSDCDAHGTTVAGIIAAADGGDGYAGVAPDAAIISIRQSSGAFAARSTPARAKAAGIGDGYGTVTTLATAVMRAVGLGATVINISEVACGASAQDLGDGALGAAVRYAYDHDVVVVVAAGNVTSSGACRTQNPLAAAQHEWEQAVTIASPAWFTPYVLTVGAVDSRTGAPASFSMRGPWVRIAAPGTDIVGLSNTRGAHSLINALQSEDGPVPLNGTSFAAPYVAGTAALVRARFPELNARQVIDRLIATAHGAGPVGVVDPVAALTMDSVPYSASQSRPIAAAALQPAPDRRPQRLAVGIAVIAAASAATILAVSLSRRRVRPLQPHEF